ncbi:MAG: cell wall-binding repeat-containing protein [Bacillota bacterium]|nr:cell wall-binding repeat-containing protein [Bacillota bacterium]
MLKRLKKTMVLILALSIFQSSLILNSGVQKQGVKESIFTQQASAETLSSPIIVDHKSTGLPNFRKIPSNWIDAAKDKLVIAYEHTSHGSQLVSGMTDLVGFAGTQYSFSADKETNKLQLIDCPFGSANLSNPDTSSWNEDTEKYLKSHPEVNVMMWSWCGEVSSSTEVNINAYLSAMNSLENEFPNVKFVYMTGHLDGSGIDGNLNQRNNQIRDYVKKNNKILYDFADIESYDPDGNEYLSKNATDGCDYTGGNWAIQWQDKHTLGVDWFETSTAHSQPLNGNLKAYAAWALFAKLAGWSGNSTSKYSVSRISGQNRYDTSVKIASAYNSGTLQNVIIATGDDFPDSLTGNVLASKLNAPILLVGKDLNSSKVTLDYIESKLDKSGNIYILGGKGAVSQNIVDYLTNKGFSKFTRLEGQDRFGTNKAIEQQLNVQKGTPVILATANDFPDSLSISSIAAIKGWPIILTNSEGLSKSAQDMISEISPSQVYLIGGEGVLKPQIISDVKSLEPNIGDQNIIRISGQNRYSTSQQVMKYFGLSTNNCVLATGVNFPDGIAGGVLAAKLNAPILLIDNGSANEQKQYLDSVNITSLTILGGTGAVSSYTEQYFD